MLESLCTLITALTCVSAVTVLTQKPTVVSLSRGESVTMDCNLGTISNSDARWYKQVPGGVPQFVLSWYHGSSSVTYGSGFSSPRFTSTHQSTSDYRLMINNLEEGDSAVYYCGTWDGSVSEVVFGPGTKLIVTSSSLPPPVLTVFPPSRAELQSNKVTLVCLSRLSAPLAEVSWLLGDTSVSSGISTSTPVQQADQTFQISSHLSILTSDWDAQKVYTCKVSVGSQTAEKSLKKSECEE
ncbi:immunoglobulin lambda-1 light chain-like [Takifugu flavidus]|uniref:immunoglobulin lambda-1 light chain-like n=1 Tax=Takifugu flavidus TaxID=433684 RepID=UPI002544C6AB|nr:immunoglobulin lambda-1 light chain-like [Takifugu flavidus]